MGQQGTEGKNRYITRRHRLAGSDSSYAINTRSGIQQPRKNTSEQSNHRCFAFFISLGRPPPSSTATPKRPVERIARHTYSTWVYQVHIGGGSTKVCHRLSLKRRASLSS